MFYDDESFKNRLHEGFSKVEVNNGWGKVNYYLFVSRKPEKLQSHITSMSMLSGGHIQKYDAEDYLLVQAYTEQQLEASIRRLNESLPSETALLGFPRSLADLNPYNSHAFYNQYTGLRSTEMVGLFCTKNAHFYFPPLLDGRPTLKQATQLTEIYSIMAGTPFTRFSHLEYGADYEISYDPARKQIYMTQTLFPGRQGGAWEETLQKIAEESYLNHPQNLQRVMGNRFSSN